MSTKQRHILVTADEVHCSSLPWSLRHCNLQAALEDARSLSVFLQEITFLASIFEDDEAFSEEGERGLMHVQRLLRDKLEIGMGVYKFPTISWSETSPELAAREENL